MWCWYSSIWRIRVRSGPYKPCTLQAWKPNLRSETLQGHMPVVTGSIPCILLTLCRNLRSSTSHHLSLDYLSFHNSHYTPSQLLCPVGFHIFPCLPRQPRPRFWFKKPDIFCILELIYRNCIIPKDKNHFLEIARSTRIARCRIRYIDKYPAYIFRWRHLNG